jgi:hypothetical protein
MHSDCLGRDHAGILKANLPARDSLKFRMAIGGQADAGSSVGLAFGSYNSLAERMEDACGCVDQGAVPNKANPRGSSLDEIRR